MSTMSVRRLGLVLAGGFCGTLARYYLAAPLLALAALVLPGHGGGFPFDIFAINLSGAFALGLLYGLAERGARISSDARLALGTGFLGAYTTFSTFTVGGDTLLLRGAWLIGALYLAGSIALGVLCAHLGHVAAGALLDHRRLSRRMRVRTRRVWRRAFVPGTRSAAGSHASGVQPWRLAHRDAPHAAPHAAHAAHASPRTSSRFTGVEAAGRNHDDHSGYAGQQEEEVY